MRSISGVAAVLILSTTLAAAQTASTKSPLDRIAFLAGRWHGLTHGEPGKGEGDRTYEFVLQDKYLRGINKTIYPAQEQNPKGEVHEDIGYFSYDRERKRLVLRQFHSEGFVNEYVEQPSPADEKKIIFETERIENIPNGWRAREAYTLVNQDEFIEVFELAEPQKDFSVYSESRWKRMK